MCLNDNGRWYGDVYHNVIVAASEDEELYKLWNERLKIPILMAFCYIP